MTADVPSNLTHFDAFWDASILDAPTFDQLFLTEQKTPLCLKICKKENIPLDLEG